ncbi:uncharacterized protein YwqG-like [Harmonia axyridis]|uniref:uncharacterized protein YwqG-like n=1 Tax=Harmonia axyridis TaxID=115357 RepID=UPI001E2758C7|nr:uncharacterized protein YwqG-like [Harmonia axyridis]
MSTPDIPEKYAPYADEIKATIKKTIKFKLQKNPDLKLWQSKVGGSPYLPLNEPYPLNSEGEPLLFLAQVNFSELPRIEEFPEEGILEFYIDGQDDILGYENKEGGFKVLYFKDIEEDETKLHSEFKKLTFPFGPFQVDASYSMDFSLEDQYMSILDYRFENIVDYEDDYDMYDQYNDLYPANGNRLWGYPYFTQSDPREGVNNLKDYELLFQLDSDESIIWGDMGVGAFFIKPDDLQKLDFTNILYNWDCY